MEKIDIAPIEKKIRAEVIKEHMIRNKIQTAVCFSCGNASKALKDAGVKLIEIAPTGDFSANRWFTQEEIASIFPNSFDATSGHLPIFLINQIAAKLKDCVKIDTAKEYEIATGSGETFVAISIAYPTVKFVPVYNESDATKYEPNAPLNALVEALTRTPNN